MSCYTKLCCDDSNTVFIITFSLYIMIANIHCIIVIIYMLYNTSQID